MLPMNSLNLTPNWQDLTPLSVEQAQSSLRENHKTENVRQWTAFGHR